MFAPPHAVSRGAARCELAGIKALTAAEGVTTLAAQRGDGSML